MDDTWIYEEYKNQKQVKTWWTKLEIKIITGFGDLFTTCNTFPTYFYYLLCSTH